MALYPLILRSTISFGPVALKQTTGVPHAIDSPSVFPNASIIEGATNTSAANIRQHNSASTVNRFHNLYIINISSEEKLVIGHTIEVVTTGAGTAPQRMEVVGKWTNTSSQITEIDIDNPNAGDYLTDSNLTVLGRD